MKTIENIDNNINNKHIKTKTTSILLNVKIKSKMVNFLFIIGKCKKMA